jgi:hypothetical protein
MHEKLVKFNLETTGLFKKILTTFLVGIDMLYTLYSEMRSFHIEMQAIKLRDCSSFLIKKKMRARGNLKDLP